MSKIRLKTGPGDPRLEVEEPAPDAVGHLHAVGRIEALASSRCRASDTLEFTVRNGHFVNGMRTTGIDVDARQSAIVRITS